MGTATLEISVVFIKTETSLQCMQKVKNNVNLVAMIIKFEKESKYGVIQCHKYMHGVKKTTDSYIFCLNEWYVAAELATYDNNRVL